MTSMTGKIGSLLVTIDNAVTTVFNDNACVTHIIPSPKYEEDGTILDITVEVLKFKYSEKEYNARINLFDELVYNPLFHSEHTLSKVNIVVVERERL
jgi:hypothetical protein